MTLTGIAADLRNRDFRLPAAGSSPSRRCWLARSPERCSSSTPPRRALSVACGLVAAVLVTAAIAS
jgi:hypothetical protein